MLSSTLTSPKPNYTFLHSPFLSTSIPLNSHHRPNKLLRKPISATVIPSSSASDPAQQKKRYQPFRPPPSESPIPPRFRDLDAPDRFEVLANRLGLWYEYAPLIPTLIQEGFTPPTIEEYTSISEDEQNRLVVAAQVRYSLVQSGVDDETLEFFDKGGAELLYEIRLLSANQRAAVAHYLVEKKFEPNDAQELARAIKDFPRRRGDYGWDCFDYTLPADCLAFMFFRQALENRDSELRTAALEKASSVAVSERARAWVSKELEENYGNGEGGSVDDEP